MQVGKIVLTRETVLAVEVGVPAVAEVVRVVGMAVIANPFAGRFVEDLTPLFEAGRALGERLMGEVVGALGGAAAVSHGKGALVGVGGEGSTGARASIRCRGGRCGPRSGAGGR